MPYRSWVINLNGTYTRTTTNRPFDLDLHFRVFIAYGTLLQNTRYVLHTSAKLEVFYAFFSGVIAYLSMKHYTDL